MANSIFKLQFTCDSYDVPTLSGMNAQDQLNELEKFVTSALGQRKKVSKLEIFATGVKSTGTITLATCTTGTVVEVNGVPFTAITSGTPTVANGEFVISGTDAADATSLAAAINGSTNTAIAGVVVATSTGASGVVTVTSVDAGLGANAVTIKTLGACATGTVTMLGVDVDDTVTINGTTLTAKQHKATGTLTAATAIAGTTCVVNGVTFTGVAGAVVTGDNQFSIDTGDTETATSLAAQINAHLSLAGVVTATSATNVVTVRAVTGGTAGNAITLVGTVTVLEASAATLEDGAAVGNNEWDVSPGSTNTQVATDFVRMVNASSTALVSGHVRARSTATVVTLQAIVPGVAGNCITLASSDGTELAVTGARLTGGTDTAWEGVKALATVTIAALGSGTYTVTINGVAAASAVAWNTDETTTATDITTAINSGTNALVRGVVTATSAAGVITVTAVRGGISGNAVTLAASGSAVTPAVSTARLISGAVPTTVVLSAARMTAGSNATLNSLNLPY